MFNEKIKGEKLNSYKPIFINRKSGEQKEADYLVSLFDSEVISKQIELSSVKTVIMFKKINNN